MRAIQIHPEDSVAVALEELQAGERVEAGGSTICIQQTIPRGHKFALRAIAQGEAVVKYGCAIGEAYAPIAPGQWVHTQNLRTRLSGKLDYEYHPQPAALPDRPAQTFEGYLREDGRAGVRNEIWILPTVGCVNGCVKALEAQNQHLVQGSIDGLYAFTHPYGCSQNDPDLEQTARLLAALAKHPNAGAVLVVGLGCEFLTHEKFLEQLGSYPKERLMFLTCQEVDDELAAGTAMLEKLAEYAGGFRRQPLPASKLTVGLKCGGSDGLSGITANPVVGAFSDLLVSQGGSSILTEVPEMFGAEQLLMDRCATAEVFEKTVSLINSYKNYLLGHGEGLSDNPSPGNLDGGITTLEDKSCGCIQKGGKAPITDVLQYAQPLQTPGLNLLYGPGNDLVSATALAASGAQLILFTTGRGTPFGCAVPTVKIATNAQVTEKKAGWIDFDASLVLRGVSLAQAGQTLFQLVLRVAGGEMTGAERLGYRQIAIFKDGVTL